MAIYLPAERAHRELYYIFHVRTSENMNSKLVSIFSILISSGFRRADTALIRSFCDSNIQLNRTTIGRITPGTSDKNSGGIGPTRVYPSVCLVRSSLFSLVFAWPPYLFAPVATGFGHVFRIFVARDIGPDGELDSSIPRDTPSIIAIPVYPNKTKCVPTARGSCIYTDNGKHDGDTVYSYSFFPLKRRVISAPSISLGSDRYGGIYRG